MKNVEMRTVDEIDELKKLFYRFFVHSETVKLSDDRKKMNDPES